MSGLHVDTTADAARTGYERLCACLGNTPSALSDCEDGSGDPICEVLSVGLNSEEGYLVAKLHDPRRLSQCETVYVVPDPGEHYTVDSEEQLMAMSAMMLNAVTTGKLVKLEYWHKEGTSCWATQLITKRK